MDLKKIGTIASYNIRLLLREKLLWFYTLGMYVVILFAQLGKQGILMGNSSSITDFSSSVPFMNAFFFLVFQMPPLVILSCHFLYKERCVDSMEALYYRPESNAEYVWGIFAAFVGVFGGAAVLSLVIAMLAHLLFIPFPLELGFYLFYLFAMIVPALVFVVGLSFFIITWIKNRTLSVTLLLGFFGGTIFYISDYQFGLIDPLGLTLPGAVSVITGHSDILGYLLQRGTWLFLGIGFVLLTILKFDRIPNEPSRFCKRGMALFFLIMGLSFGASFFFLNQSKLWKRSDYASVYAKYSSCPKAYLESQDIEYDQNGDEMFVNTEIVVRNRTDKELDKVLLYLNPGLEVMSLATDEASLLYEREEQVIIVPMKLSPGDSLRLKLSYKGRIDERFCYLNVPDNEFVDTRKHMYLACRLGKHYAYLRKDFTLLLPEISWYPTTIPPENPSSRYDNSRDFTRYSLRVRNRGKNKVISQGVKRRKGDQTIFRNEYPLPGITLNIGDYVTQRLSVDSITYELHVWRKHAPLIKLLNERMNNLPVTLLLRNARHIAEVSTGKKYPYKRFQFVETPLDFISYFRNEMNCSGFVQPEVLYFPERGFGTNVFFWETEDAINSLLFDEEIRRDAFFSWDNILGWDVLWKKMRFDGVVYDKNPHVIYAQLGSQVSGITSLAYPFLNCFVNFIIEDNNQTRIESRRPLPPPLEQQAIDYLRSHSLKDALQDNSLDMAVLNTISILKERELVDIFQTKGVDLDSLVSFLLHFSDKHRFEMIDFDQLNEEFKAIFCVDWNSVLPAWYTSNRIPEYLLKYTDVIRVKSENPKDRLSRIEFAIFNDSDVDGIVNIRTSTFLPGGRLAILQAYNEKRRESIIKYQAFEVKAKTGKRFAFVVNELRDFMVNMNIAENLPNFFNLRQTGVFTSDTTQYVKDVSRDYFLPDTNEFIVDNTDPGCKIIQPSTLLKLKNNDRLNADKSWIRFVNFKEVICIPTSRWNEYISKDGQGTTIRSFVFTRGKSGNYRMEWDADLPREGGYEAFVYIPAYAMNLKVQKYKISPLGGEEKVVYIDPGAGNKWFSLGVYDCVPGVSKISLSDEGEENQMIIGDAIKWVYLGQDNVIR